jgi:hypothetical protein
MRRSFVALSLLCCALPAHAAFCPSYTRTSSGNSNNCGVDSQGGTNPSVDAWHAIIETACAGPKGAGWDNGPDVPQIGRGCTTTTKVDAHFPCELVEAIAMQESGWVQFCAPTGPADQVGLPSRTIISFDCGYGIAQVTSGMHNGETPAFDRDRVAGEALYALEVGLKILGEKWSATACVGDNQPDLVEDWYLATWAYNGLSFSNNPNNPNLDAARPPCDPNVGCAGRTYQEKVWGWMEHPPASGGVARWAAIEPAYPDASELPMASGVKIPNLSEPSCASPTSCAQTRAPHGSRCSGADLGLVDGGGGDAGQPGDDGGCGCTLGRRGPLSFPSCLLVLTSLGLVIASRRRARR